MEKKVLPLCNECTSKARLGFPQFEITESGNMERTTCGHCGKNRYCLQVTMTPKARKIVG